MKSINFTPQDIVRLIKEKTQLGLQAVQCAKTGQNWQEVFNPLDEAEFELGKILSVNSHLNAVVFDEDFNQQYEKTLPIINDYYHQISTNKALYQAFLNLKNDKLNAEKSHILQQVILDFELSGLGLNDKQLTKFKNINEKLSLLSNQFSKNTLQATNEWIKPITLKDLGKNYPKHLLSKLKTNKGYALNLQPPIYTDVITYCENRALRQELYLAYVSRASEIGITSLNYDNSVIMSEILEYRKQKANLLGFENYAELSLAKKMVKNSQEVVDFLENLVIKVKPKAIQELAELTNFAKEYGFDNEDLLPWDVAFYSEKFKTQKYGFSKLDLLPFFPEKQVLSGLFDLIEQLYSVTFKPVKEQTYHTDVQVFKLYSQVNNTYIGKLYLDLYARENKRSGAWMADYQGLLKNQTLDEKPIAFVVCNLNSPTEDKPALFEFDEIITIFHEFGHALHHLLTTTKYPSVAGINGVPWDGVELPSQMIENFCYEQFVIDLTSGHYQTEQRLPDDLYQKLVASANFQSAMQLIRQCEFALWDIKTHLVDKPAYEVLTEVREQTALMPTIAESRFLNTFGHIFSGGYAAGYYSYLWAEVLAADAFLYLKSQRFSPMSTQAFREHILQVGGSADFMKQYQKFRGKKPSIEALLKVRGLS